MMMFEGALIHEDLLMVTDSLLENPLFLENQRSNKLFHVHLQKQNIKH